MARHGVLLCAVVALSAMMMVAAEIPLLSSTCAQFPSQDCCPAHRILLELEESGCVITDITAGDAATAEATCSACGHQLSDMAQVYRGASGEACAIVQHSLSLFPFACETDTDGTLCAPLVLPQIAAITDGSTPTSELVTSVCKGCWKKFLDTMKQDTYDHNGIVTPSYADRIGGQHGAQFCMQVGGEYCLPLKDELSNLPAMNDYLYLYQANDLDQSFCSGCKRALLSNYAEESRTSATDREFARRLLLASCNRADGNNCRQTVNENMVVAEQERVQTTLGACAGLFQDGNQVCLPACKTALTGLYDRMGCCTRYLLENVLLANAAPTGFPTDAFAHSYNLVTLADMAEADGGCGTNIAATCTDGHRGFTMYATSDFASPQTTEERILMAYGFRRDMARILGGLLEDAELNFNDNSATLTTANAAGTAVATDVYNSLSDNGAILLTTTESLLAASSLTGTANVATEVCPADAVPNYHYLPEQDVTVTTDCITLKDSALGTATLDCTTAEFVVGGVDYWKVQDGLLGNAGTC